MLLRDDKSFPFILLREDHAFPRVQKHRGARRTKGQYYGPFASAGSVTRTLNALQKLFLLRSCSDSFFANRSRPCLLYQIKRCSAPCVDEAARLMLIVGAVTLLGAVGAAWLVAGRILRPLRDITETARTITETDLSQRIPHRGGDGDELGDLVATVNGMLDRVENGVAAQRRFVDDAGHELRTPITIIRGHLDVLDPTDPVDVTSTVSLVDNELERMNRMVSDLLLLAQSEQPAFLHPEPVDVAALTTDTFDKVAAAR